MKYYNDFEYTLSKKICESLNINICKITSNYCLTILKPECLLTNKVQQTLNIYREYGYQPVYIKVKKLCEEQVLSLWKYGWGNATLSRIVMNYITMCWNYCAIIILKSANSLTDACEHLNSFKGPSVSTANNPTTNLIRSRLHSLNNFLNFVHISDCANDLLRELPILFAHNELIELGNIINQDLTLNEKEVQTILQPYISHYKIEDPDKLFRKYVNSVSQNNVYMTKQLAVALKSAYENKTISIDLLFELIDKKALYWSWETIVIFSQYIDYT